MSLEGWVDGPMRKAQIEVMSDSGEYAAITSEALGAWAVGVTRVDAENDLGSCLSEWAMLTIIGDYLRS